MSAPLNSTLLLAQHLTRSAQIGLELANFLPMLILLSKLANTPNPFQHILHTSSGNLDSAHHHLILSSHQCVLDFLWSKKGKGDSAYSVLASA